MDKDYIRDKIAQIMSEKGIRQVDLANAIGISPYVVNHWFTGTSTTYMLSLDKIAKCFGVSMDYLVGNDSAGTKDSDIKDYLEELKNRGEMRMLFKAAKGATKEDIEKAAKIIDVLKEKSDG